MTTDEQIRELQRQVAEADDARRHAQAVSSELVKEKRALQAALTHLRSIALEAASAPGKDWLEWQIKLGAALDATAQQASETILSVTEWANGAFGQATIRTQIERTKKEFDELLDLLVVSGGLRIDEKVAEEAADVCICLYRVIGTLDPEAINKKMAKNRARKWKVDGNGTAQHVGE